MRAWTIAAVMFALTAGCASDRMPTSAEVASFQQVTGDLAATAATYCAGAPTVQSPSDCSNALQRYMGRAIPDVDQMRHLAASMDEQMAAFGRTLDRDLVCGMDVIDAELARHAADACASPEMATDRAEAGRHCDAMQPFMNHLQMRSAELTGMMGAPSGMGGGMGWHDVDGGWTMPDGGWMGWDHEMPGCSYADGGYSMMDGGMPGSDGGMPGMDGGIPRMDGGMPGSDGGMPAMDGGMPGSDGGMPGMDGGHMIDGGMH